jgi:uncharacterized membrane protein
MDASGILRILVRWVHIASVVTLIGGFIFARLAVWPALASLGAAESSAFVENMTARFRSILYLVLATTLGSGLYNYLSKPSYPPHYHMVIGIKFLFVLHIFAVTFLYTLPIASQAKRRRWLTGMAISGLIVIAISSVLRWMSAH